MKEFKLNEEIKYKIKLVQPIRTCKYYLDFVE